jgi:hypothetical protein
MIKWILNEHVRYLKMGGVSVKYTIEQEGEKYSMSSSASALKTSCYVCVFGNETAKNMLAISHVNQHVFFFPKQRFVEWRLGGAPSHSNKLCCPDAKEESCHKI